MRVGLALRILAITCIVASMPLACLKYPWLPATVVEFVDLQHDPYPLGTESYHQDRARRLSRVTLALLLYTLGTVSLVGLCFVAKGAMSRRVQAASWLISAATGVGIAQFEQPRIGPSTDHAYVVMTIYFPLGIAALSGAAALVTLALQRYGDALPNTYQAPVCQQLDLSRRHQGVPVKVPKAR